MDRTRPARQFEMQTGFAGLSHDYVLSPGFHEQAQNLLGAAGRAVRGMTKTEPHALSESIIADACDFAAQFNSLAWPVSKLSRDWANTLHQRLAGLVDKVIAENPGSGLEHVQIDRSDLKQVRDFLLGVTSGFKAEDLQYYMHEMPPTPDHTVFDAIAERGGRITVDMPSFEGYMSSVQVEALGHKIGTSIGWRPAPATLESIKRQAGLEHWSPSAEELERAEIEVLGRDHRSIRFSQPTQAPEIRPGADGMG